MGKERNVTAGEFSMLYFMAMFLFLVANFPRIRKVHSTQEILNMHGWASVSCCRKTGRNGEWENN